MAPIGSSQHASPLIPAIFIGHGSPMNALESNDFTERWERLASSLPRPRQILTVSAHWYQRGVRVTISERPRTIHDFSGFPKQLHEVQYPAPGSPELARQIRDLLSPTPVLFDEEWGLDHGAWSVLLRMFPRADIPVVQLGLDERLDPEDHFALARRLGVLRDQGTLILGTGNVVHNLQAYAWGRHSVEPFDWARRFESKIRAFIEAREFAQVARYGALGRDAALAAPTPEHLLPLLYVLGQHRPNDEITFPVDGFDGGSISMLSVKVGRD
jgi:4,5-DOPA dioxygenase extradiol